MHRRHLLKTIAAGALAPLVAESLGATAATAPPASRAVRVAIGPVPLHADPSLGARVTAMAPACASGVMAPDTATLADGFRWVRLTLDETGATGWVPTWYLGAVDV